MVENHGLLFLLALRRPCQPLRGGTEAELPRAPGDRPRLLPLWARPHTEPCWGFRKWLLGHSGVAAPQMGTKARVKSLSDLSETPLSRQGAVPASPALVALVRTRRCQLAASSAAATAQPCPKSSTVPRREMKCSTWFWLEMDFFNGSPWRAFLPDWAVLPEGPGTSQLG